jgi:hypothetical protein
VQAGIQCLYPHESLNSGLSRNHGYDVA